MRAWRLLATGMGGWDWQGLPVVVELLGVTDIEALIERLQTIKTYRRRQRGEPEED
jgi:hypothetical protein